MSTIADFEIPCRAATILADELHPTVLQTLIRSAINEFLRDTGIARDELYLHGQCNVDEYLITLPNCHRLYSVEVVAVSGSECKEGVYDPDSWDEIKPADSLGTYRFRSGYYMDVHVAPNIVLKLQETVGDKRIYVSYAFTIGDQCEVPDFILMDWEHVVTAKVAAKIKQRQGLPTQQEDSMYMSGVRSAKARVKRAYSRGKLTATAAPFLGRSRRD